MMKLRTDRVTRGFTLIELIVVLALVSILVAAALERYRYLQASAERTAMEQNLANLRAAILMRSAELAAGNRWQALQRLPEENPFQLMEQLPPGYGTDPAGEPGSWRFDPARRLVVYRVRSNEEFVAQDGGREIRFRLQGMNSLGQAVQGTGTAYVVLKPAGQYVWQDRPVR